ncbi:metallophosphoesterase [Anaerococcus sp. mt242]|uniref:metallophosphoesterase family protein n=1 Tax=Anaerococcus sp. mt242 TaxID=2661917 RepID=UPI001934A090|nr:metallophosphoesterase [Anaerococcus sp. mt242]MBM0046546.1 metallophosphoesterase [Anaerococcus sp. mt242]
MKKYNKLVLALAIASASSAIFPVQNTYAAEDTAVVEYESTTEQSDESLNDLLTEEADLESTTYSSDSHFNFTDDEVTFPKNEANVRKSDGTNKFNRATETERETFGEDKNVTNIDENVAKKLEETNGEYGKKDGEYANHNLKAITTPIKNIVVNNGKNENELAITWFAKGDVTDSRLVFDGKEYEPVRARKTGDVNDYSTYTAIVNITPGKSYTYYVKSGSYKSDNYTVKTKALGENNEFKVGYFGDPQMGSGDSVWDSKGLYKNTQAKVDQDKVDFAKSLKKARELDPHFYLSMGDNVEIVNYEGEYDYFLDNDLFKDSVFSTVVGNHETYVDASNGSQRNTVFSDHFYLPNESKLGSISKINEDGTAYYIPGDYYYSYGDTLFLNINSNVNDSKEHEAFIKDAIAKATKERGKNFSWKVVSFHHAPYSTATHTSDTDILERRHELVRIFNENGIDLVLNGHDHIYTRTGQMIAGEQVLSFEDAYGTDPKNENAGIKDGFTKTYNNRVYKDNKVVVDGIKLDYNQKEVTNPRGTLFLTMSTSAGSKFYNPIGEDQWFVNRSLDDRSQLFSSLTFSKNIFNIKTMNPYGEIVDFYTINKTDDFINNPGVNKDLSKSKLEALVKEAKNNKPVNKEENVELYNLAIERAEEVLNATFTSEEEVDAAVEVLNTRLSNVEFLAENKDDKKTDDKKTDDKKTDDKKPAKQVKGEKAPKAAKLAKKENKADKKEAKKSDNPKTGVATLTGVYATLSVAAAGLFVTKRK